MLHVELPYVSRVGLYLEGFAHKNQYLWNARCPICGDKTSSGRVKKRFYIYRPGTANHLNAKCHHCGYSVSFGTFLKEYQPQMYKEMVFDNYNTNSKAHTPHKNIEEVYKPKKLILAGLQDSNLEGLKSCANLKDTHPVAKFLAKRLIPKDKYELLYYTLKFKKYTNQVSPDKFKSDEEDHPRLVIPYFDNHGKMFAFVARAFGKEEPRYYTIKLDDRERIYGLDRLDNRLNKVYAVEGPIDSLFLPNCIAVSGSNFDCDTVRALKSVLTLVPDNEPRSKEICKLIKKHIDLGYKVCMLPHSIKTKDINEHILSGMNSQDIQELIDANTFQGPEAVLHFSHWKLV